MLIFFRYIFLLGFVFVSSSVFGTEVKNFDNEKIKLPRVKHLYISGSASYLYQNNNMYFNDIDDCKGSLKAEFFCKQNPDGSYENNKIKTSYRAGKPFSVALGVNSDDAIRFELNYQLLNKDLVLNGVNQDGINYNQYTSNLKFETGSINVFLDFLSQRNDTYSVFIPYIMGGFGFSGITIGDVIFRLADGSEWNFQGSSKDNKTYILGFGVTAGVNSYISLDIGYRYYNLGDIETEKIAIKKDSTGAITKIEHIGLKSNLKANSIGATIKFQI